MKAFFYGTLKHNESRDASYYDAKYLGDGVLPGYDLYSLGMFPAIVPGTGRVPGEVWEVDSFDVYDRIEGHPHFYRRTLATLEDGTEVSVYVINNLPSRASRIDCW